jgi:hypothetical protein
MITLPVIAVVTPAASLAAGNLLLGESARLGVLTGALAALAVLVTSAGLVVLARLTTGQPGPVRSQGSFAPWPAWPAWPAAIVPAGHLNGEAELPCWGTPNCGCRLYRGPHERPALHAPDQALRLDGCRERA